MDSANPGKAQPASRHLLIAGTGRTGTSFLVRYLTQLGLDTHSSRRGSDSEWDDPANAGLENFPLPDASDLPYVIKSPWSYELIRPLLEAGTLAFDAIILPMRDLTEAATSRTIVQLRAVHEAHHWMGDLDRTWETWGHTPGGIVYSLNPIDQARLLAVGFHQLLETLVRYDVPVILLSFPRLIEDPDYLHAKLAPVLPGSVTADLARAAHAAIAEPKKVRVGEEIQERGDSFRLQGPGQLRLEHAALRRLLQDTRAALEEARTSARKLEAERDSALTQRQAGEAAVAAMTAALREAEAAGHRTTHAAAEAHARERDSLIQELAQARGSLRTFLRHYLPQLRRFLVGR